MKAKMIYLAISSLCLLSATPFVYADDYDRRAEPRHGQEHHGPGRYDPRFSREHRNDDRNKVAISINMPGVVTQPHYYAPAARPHHRRPPVYVCQTNFRGNIYRGRIVGKTCAFTWGRREVTTTTFRIVLG